MTDTRKLVALHMCANNDTNGNPRRVFVLLNKYGAIVATVDEGYMGWAAVKDAGFPNAHRGPAFAITPAEYRDLTRKDRPHRAGESAKAWATV